MSLPEALENLRRVLADMTFPVPSAHAEDAEEVRKDIVHQLEDYILPRYASLDAPLIVVVGGSTGSGKSELIISMLLSLCIRYAPDYLNIILIRILK